VELVMHEGEEQGNRCTLKCLRLQAEEVHALRWVLMAGDTSGWLPTCLIMDLDMAHVYTQVCL
jgi:hypothetical protein